MLTFTSTSAKDGAAVQHVLNVNEFIRRFLQHVLPRQFVKVRYYGLWAPACRDKLAAARTILDVAGALELRDSGCMPR